MCIQLCNNYDNSVILLIVDDDPTTPSIVTDNIGMGEGSGTLSLNDY